MFEKRRALTLYKKMLFDLNETREIMKRNERYNGIDSGYVIVPIKDVNDKLTHYLKSLALQDGFNFNFYQVKHSLNNSQATIYSIDNEPIELKEKRRLEVEEYVDSVVNGSKPKQKCKIVNIADFNKNNYN